MPVEDHEVHEKVRITEDKPYGCHNRDQFADAYYAPNRFFGSDGYKPMIKLEAVRIPFTMSRECRYDMSLKDQRCDGCKHRGSGEQYAAKVRSSGK